MTRFAKPDGLRRAQANGPDGRSAMQRGQHLDEPLRVDRDALTVAMAVAPGSYSRNRMFALHTNPEVRRAKGRAAVLRGVLSQLGGAQGLAEGITFDGSDAMGRTLLRYRIANLRYERCVELTAVEAACLRYLAGRANVAGLRASSEDRALLAAALRRLMGGVGPLGALASTLAPEP